MRGVGEVRLLGIIKNPDEVMHRIFEEVCKIKVTDNPAKLKNKTKTFIPKAMKKMVYELLSLVQT